MSIKVMNWAWERSRATGGDLLVLLAIADHANDDGTNAYPTVDTLGAKCRMSHRSIQRALVRLTALGELAIDRNRGGQATTPVFWRPNRYAVLLHAGRFADSGGDNLTPGDQPAAPGDAVDNRQQEGVAPVVTAGGVVESLHERGDSLTPRRPGRGGVDVTTPGDADDTTPGASAVTQNRPNEPSLTNRHPTAWPMENGASPLGGVVEEFFAALGTRWRLSGRQRQRLTPHINAAASAGWTVADLAAYVGANTAGVRNPYAVLQSRLTDLPAPPRRGPARPAWCGRCEEHTRLRENPDGRPARCLTCHPLAPAVAPARERSSHVV